MIDINASLRDILSKSGQGFDQMLAGVQGGIGKLDASLQYARQKREQYALLDYKRQQDLSYFKETELEKAKVMAQGQVQEEVVKGIVKQEENRQKAIELQIKEADNKSKAITETMKTSTKNAMDFGFIRSLPRVGTKLNETTGNINFSIEDIYTRTQYSSPEEYLTAVAPLEQFAIYLKEANVDVKDLAPFTETVTQDGKTVTLVGASDFAKDLNKIQNARSVKEVLPVIQQYTTGAKFFNKSTKEKATGVPMDAKLRVALTTVQPQFNSLWTTTEMEGESPKISLSNLELLRKELFEKYSKAKADDKSQYEEKIKQVDAMYTKMELALTEFLEVNPDMAAKRNTLTFDQTKKALTFFDPYETEEERQAREDAALLGGE